MILQRLMENLQIDGGTQGKHEDAKYFLQDGTPYHGPTHVDENMLRRTGIMHSPESMPVFTQEQLKALMERLQIQQLQSGGIAGMAQGSRQTMQSVPGPSVQNQTFGGGGNQAGNLQGGGG